ncbi:ATP phosphoribosyltransferase [Halorubrum gandharaense]
MHIAVPNKGRLHEPTLSLLERAGLHVEETADRQLYADTVDPDVSVLFARAADIPEYVRDGAADLGITGLDQASESGGVAASAAEADEDDLVDLLDLEYGSCDLVLAAPEDGDIESVEDLAGKTVATEFPNVTRDYFARVGVDAEIVTVTGATELTPHVDMADAIVDITSTGTTLKVNRLAVIDDVLASSVRLFARPDVVDDPKVEQVRTALESVLAADGQRYLMMNAPKERLDDVKDVIPGLGGPTVMNVEADENGNGMVAVHAVVDERDVFATISDLKQVGASGILVTEIERLVE